MSYKELNLTAYDKFEELNNFNNKKLNDYRQAKINSASGHVSFIKKHFPGGKLKVLELGSGNSKTLYALDKAEILIKGWGVEISRSRYEFAERWKKEWEITRVENINKNVLDLNFIDFKDADLCFCVDLAFQFFEPIERGSALRVLRAIHNILPVGGKIIIELDESKRVLRNIVKGSAKLWEEFSCVDPWRFSLWDCKYDKNKKYLTWGKTFVKRNGNEISETCMVLRIYNREESKRLLGIAGFKTVEVYPDWGVGDLKNNPDEFIIVGTK